VNGIFNIGTGKARSWNDLAKATFDAMGKEVDIEYVSMPEHLQDKYQYFTQADISKLTEVGYDKPITLLEDAVKDYVCNYLENDSFLAG
jgi:ADP-L-glycero-D-manno-heptose 6-epimerase